MATTLLQKIESLASSLCAEQGLELVDTELKKEDGHRFVRIFIYKAGGLDLDSCERFHRAFIPLIDDIVDYDYLEVSSPGDRPLKSAADFRRNAGGEVEVRLYRALDGKKVFEGELIGLEDNIIKIICGGETKEFPKETVAAVKPVFRLPDEEDGEWIEIDEEEL